MTIANIRSKKLCLVHCGIHCNCERGVRNLTADEIKELDTMLLMSGEHVEDLEPAPTETPSSEKPPQT